MATVGEEIKRHEEEQAEREQLELQRLQALEQQRQEERARRERLKNLARQVAKREVKRIAGQAGKKAAMAAGRAAVSAIGSALAAIAPYVGIALLVLAVIAGTIVFTMIVVSALCNAGGWTGAITKGLSAVGGVVGLPGGGWCEQLSGISGVFGGATGSGARGGQCVPCQGGPASVSSLSTTCFDGNALQASSIASAESGCDPRIGSAVDRCQPGGEIVSWGLFQINISANPVGSLNCPAAFDRPYTGSNRNCRVVNQSLYDSCVAAAQDISQNIQTACLLSGNGTNWGAWGANQICGF